MKIKSMLDIDLYKFTTSYAYMKMFPNTEGTFEFKDRDNTIYDENFLEELKSEIYMMSNLKLLNRELFWASNNIRFIPRFYWEWLSSFRLDPCKINISLDKENHLHIKVTDLLYKATLYETPILTLVSYFRSKMLKYKTNRNLIIDKLKDKVLLSNQIGLKFSEFGMRYGFSYEVQDWVVKYLKENAIYYVGTSNVHLAMKYSLKPIGTHSHEWFIFHRAQFSYKYANYMALENWINVYDGDLGIALSDTFTYKIFLENFSKKHAKLFDGIRQDSGDPFKFINEVIKKYKELGIDPTTKTIVFSNTLDMPTYKKILNYCKNKIKCSVSIGTNLTNDTKNPPANIVMELTKCWVSGKNKIENCIKFSDDIKK